MCGKHLLKHPRYALPSFLELLLTNTHKHTHFAKLELIFLAAKNEQSFVLTTRLCKYYIPSRNVDYTCFGAYNTHDPQTPHLARPSLSLAGAHTHVEPSSVMRRIISSSPAQSSHYVKPFAHKTTVRNSTTKYSHINA